MNPLLPIYIALAFVNPDTGAIVASAHGAAANMAECARIASEDVPKVFAENPKLAGTVPIVNCWDVRVQLSHIPHGGKPAAPAQKPPSTDL